MNDDSPIPMPMFGSHEVGLATWWISVCSEITSSVLGSLQDHTLGASDMQAVVDLAASVADLAADAHRQRDVQFRRPEDAEQWHEIYLDIVRELLVDGYDGSSENHFLRAVSAQGAFAADAVFTAGRLRIWP